MCWGGDAFLKHNNSTIEYYGLLSYHPKFDSRTVMWLEAGNCEQTANSESASTS